MQTKALNVIFAFTRFLKGDVTLLKGVITPFNNAFIALVRLSEDVMTFFESCYFATVCFIMHFKGRYYAFFAYVRLLKGVITPPLKRGCYAFLRHYST